MTINLIETARTVVAARGEENKGWACMASSDVTIT